MCSFTYSAHSAARTQHTVHQPGRELIVRHRIAHGLVEVTPADLAETNAERFQRMTDSIFEIEELALQVAPLDQQQPHPVAGLRLDMRSSEPARAHDVREAEGVGRVGLVALGRHRGAHVAGLQAHDRNALFLEPRVQRRCKCAGLMPDTPELPAIGLQRRRDRPRIGRHRCRHHHFSSLIDDTDRGLVDRHIQSGKAVHSRSPALPHHPRL